ncbi:hypothetical protein [Streptomyces sp. NRRL B-1347]|uniref:hypothetical protein n=1 Tax=Streptomyces sp. NRRL B-1347 TaxID=1476877 RepID=UPI00131DEB79|nr:hypothetical protein [Streptomyces sp. NRRL B-1347]
MPSGQDWPRADAGHPDYRHPEEDGELHGVRLDAFPASVVFLSALAVAADPSLWKLHTQENLIFRAADCARARGRTGSPEDLVAALHR